jgi:hypothetical protein
VAVGDDGAHTGVPSENPICGILRCQPPLVAMVQPADLWNGDNLASINRLNRAGFGWVAR